MVGVFVADAPPLTSSNTTGPSFSISGEENGGLPRCCAVLCRLRGDCITAMLASRNGSSRLVLPQLPVGYQPTALLVSYAREIGTPYYRPFTWIHKLRPSPCVTLVEIYLFPSPSKGNRQGKAPPTGVFKEWWTRR